MGIALEGVFRPRIRQRARITWKAYRITSKIHAPSNEVEADFRDNREKTRSDASIEKIDEIPLSLSAPPVLEKTGSKNHPGG